MTEAQAEVKGRQRWRAALSAVLITVACILAPLSAVAVWASGEVTDTDRYLQTVAPLASDPAIQGAIADRVTTEVVSAIDFTTLTQDAVSALTGGRELRPRAEQALQSLVAPLSSAVESYTNQAVTKIVQSPQFETVWIEANTVVHQQLNRALSGEVDGGAVQLQDNQVVLQLSPLIADVKQRLIDRGLSVAEQIPDTTDASIVLLETPNATTAQRAYAALDSLGIVLPLVTVVLALAGVVVARRRATALAWLGFGLLVLMGAAATGLAVGRGIALEQVPAGASLPAATAFFDQLTAFLKQSLLAGVVLGAVLLIGGLAMGTGRLGRSARSLPITAAAGIQRGMAGGGLQLAGLRGWVRRHATVLRLVAALIALLVLASQRYKTPELVLWTAAGLLVALFVIQILASGEDAQPAT